MHTLSAAIRTVSCNFVSRAIAKPANGTSLSERLSPHGNAHAAHVAAVVKGAYGDGVFSGRHDRKIKRISLASAISDAIIRKRRIPG